MSEYYSDILTGTSTVAVCRVRVQITYIKKKKKPP